MTLLIESATARLRLHQWQDSDFPTFAQMNADPIVMDWLGEPLDRASSDALAHRLRTFMRNRGWGVWAIELPQTQTFIGFTGLNIPTVPLPFKAHVEIGWRLAPAYWGQGYATEAALEALRIGFEILNLPEIVAFTATCNLRSQAVMDRLHMRRQPGTFEHPAVPIGSHLREHYWYRLTAQDFAFWNPRPLR